MITVLRRHLRRALATRKPLVSLSKETACEAETQLSIIDALIDAREVGQAVSLREIHRMVNISQSEALRCVRRLEERRVVAVEESIHDPLSSHVRLK